MTGLRPVASWRPGRRSRLGRWRGLGCSWGTSTSSKLGWTTRVTKSSKGCSGSWSRRHRRRPLTIQRTPGRLLTGHLDPLKLGTHFQSLQDNSEGITSSGGIKGAAETMGVAAKYITAHPADNEVVVTTLEPTRDGKLHRGTGMGGGGGGNSDKEEEEKKPWLLSPSSQAGQKVWHLSSDQTWLSSQRSPTLQVLLLQEVQRQWGSLSFAGRKWLQTLPKASGYWLAKNHNINNQSQ